VAEPDSAGFGQRAQLVEHALDLSFDVYEWKAGFRAEVSQEPVEIRL